MGRLIFVGGIDTVSSVILAYFSRQRRFTIPGPPRLWLKIQRIASRVIGAVLSDVCAQTLYERDAPLMFAR